MNMISTENFILEDMSYFPTSSFNPVLSRPYIVHATQSAIDTIAQRMDETKSVAIKPSMLAGVASEIVVPSTVGVETHVNRDWVSTRRFVFMLKVKSFDATGLEMNSYIQGFTEHDGISPTGNIDGNMVHHINNVIETSVMTINTPTGVIRKEKLFRIYNVFASKGQEDLFVQRPTDVLENINFLNMSNMMGNGVSQMNSFGVQNYINPFNQNTVASTADNGVTTEYLSKILTTGIMVNKSQEIHLDSYSASEQSSVESKVPEPALSDNRFLKYLSAMSGSRTVRDVFNFNQLMAIDNTIFSRFNYYDLTKDVVDPVLMATPEVGDFWHGQDPVTPKAYVLLENAVAMAVKYGFNKIYFTATNMNNPSAMPEFFLTNFKSFINLDDRDFGWLIEIFKEKFMTEVFMNESNMGRIPIHMEGYVDLLGTSKIHLSYAGYPSNWYTIPTFANSMFSQVATIDKNAFDYTTVQLNNVITTLSNNTNAAQHMPAYYG